MSVRLAMRKILTTINLVIMVEIVVAVVLLALSLYAEYDNAAKGNKAQADKLLGLPVDVLEIKKWTSQHNIIWVKVTDLRPFAPSRAVTIIDSTTGQTDFAGLYMCKDVWKDFPEKDPQLQLQENIVKQVLLGMGVRWDKYESLPFAHTKTPGVLKLEAIPKDTNLPNHNEQGGNALIFGGDKLNEGVVNEMFYEKVKITAAGLLTGPNAWKYGVALLALIVLITLFTKKKAK